MSELLRVLCVDDEPNVLSGLKRQLRSKFDVHTAESGSRGLELLKEKGPFPVVVSDMRMPNMNGATFLSKVREVSPSTMRILLTGQSDIESAAMAINEGQIYRFLTKPCPSEALISTLNSAIEQNRLLNIEKELLEKTLHGSIKVLTDILSLTNPLAFSRSSKIRQYVVHMMSKLKVPGKWQYELAAMLSQIGCVTVPADILSKVYADQKLSEDEENLFNTHPTVGHDLITKIPRLKLVAQIIKSQKESYVGISSKPISELEPTILGSQILSVATELDRYLSNNVTLETAISNMRQMPDNYHPELIQLLNDLKDSKPNEIRKTVHARELTPAMTIDEDIYATNGALLISKGQEVTDAVRVRLTSMSSNKSLKEPFRVVINN